MADEIGSWQEWARSVFGRLDGHSKSISSQEERLRAVENEVTALKVKVSLIALAAGSVPSIIQFLVKLSQQ